jgi:hypothetical protein
MNALVRLARPVAPLAFRRSIGTSKPAFGSKGSDSHHDHHDHHDHRVFDPHGFDMTMPSTSHRCPDQGFLPIGFVLCTLLVLYIVQWLIVCLMAVVVCCTVVLQRRCSSSWLWWALA